MSRVSQLRPSGGSFDSALVEYRAARFRSCLWHLGRADEIRERLLRARTLLRLQEPDRALQSLHDLTGSLEIERAEIALLRAVALSRLDADASDPLSEAATYALASGNVAIQAETFFYKALIAFGQDRLHDARIACKDGLAVTQGAKTDPNFVFPIPHIVSRIYELLGVISAADGQYLANLSHVKLAFSILDRCDVVDVYQQSFGLRNLTILSRDFDLEEDIFDLSSRTKKLAWTDEISVVRCATLEALGWCFALRGDIVESLRLFREATSVATSVPEYVLLGVDRAIVARSFGHRPMVVEEIEHAAKLAFAFDWNTAAGDLRNALLCLAQVAVCVDPKIARGALDRYNEISTPMNRNFAARLEDRVCAEEAFTNGVVMRAEGQIAASIERLTFAFSTWERIGYEWRAARAALELAELDAGEPFLKFVKRDLKIRPISIFARRAYEAAV